VTSSCPSRQAQLRALVIALAVAWHGLAAAPSPKSISRAQFRHPVALEELDRWVGLLGEVGVETTRPELVDHLVSTGGALVAVRSALLAPVQPVFRLTGTGQGWGLFAYPDSFPDRLIVEGRTGGEDWAPLYRALEPDHAFLAPQLTYRRVRGVYDGHTDRPGRPYDNFARWVAREAFAAQPALVEVRVRFQRTHTLPPTQPADPKTTSRLKRVVRPEDL